MATNKDSLHFKLQVELNLINQWIQANHFNLNITKPIYTFSQKSSNRKLCASTIVGKSNGKTNSSYKIPGWTYWRKFKLELPH